MTNDPDSPDYEAESTRIQRIGFEHDCMTHTHHKPPESRHKRDPYFNKTDTLRISPRRLVRMRRRPETPLHQAAQTQLLFALGQQQQKSCSKLWPCQLPGQHDQADSFETTAPAKMDACVTLAERPRKSRKTDVTKTKLNMTLNKAAIF